MKLAVLYISLVWTTACSPDLTDKFRPIYLVRDTPEVERLLEHGRSFQADEKRELDRYTIEEHALLQRADRGDTAAWAQVKEMRAHPERYVPERVALIDTMAAQSQIEVPPSSQCRELELTDIIFSRDLTTNPHFAKVEIISGAAKGQVGWTCFPGDIHRTNAMP